MPRQQTHTTEVVTAPACPDTSLPYQCQSDENGGPCTHADHLIDAHRAAHHNQDIGAVASKEEPPISAATHPPPPPRGPVAEILISRSEIACAITTTVSVQQHTTAPHPVHGQKTLKEATTSSLPTDAAPFLHFFPKVWVSRLSMTTQRLASW